MHVFVMTSQTDPVKQLQAIPPIVGVFDLGIEIVPQLRHIFLISFHI